MSPRTRLLALLASGAVLAALGGLLAYLRHDPAYWMNETWDEPDDGVQPYDGHAVFLIGWDERGPIYLDSWGGR